MSIQPSTLAARIAETNLNQGDPPSCSIISPAGEREVTGPGSVTNAFLNALPEPAHLPKMTFNDVSQESNPTPSKAFNLNLSG